MTTQSLITSISYRYPTDSKSIIFIFITIIIKLTRKFKLVSCLCCCCCCICDCVFLSSTIKMDPSMLQLDRLKLDCPYGFNQNANRYFEQQCTNPSFDEEEIVKLAIKAVRRQNPKTFRVQLHLQQQKSYLSTGGGHHKLPRQDRSQSAA